MIRKPSVGLLSAVPRLNETLSLKIKNVNFINVRDNTVETIKANNLKILIADSDLLSEIMYEVPSVDWVQGTWAGFDKVLSKYDPKKPIHYVITRNTGFHYGAMIAEYVIANLVSWERNFYYAWHMQDQQKWCKVGRVADYQIIRDLRFSILGAGIIGKYVASVLKNLGASQIWGLVLSSSNIKPSFIDFIRTNEDIEEVLKNSDVIINVLPGTDLTAGLLNINNLSLCEKAVFINCGRGTIITECDIIEAIKKNYLSAAILDVFPDEPLYQDSPLWKMKQVKITPHVAAVPRSRDVADVFIKNWDLWMKKQPFPVVLDFSKQY